MSQQNKVNSNLTLTQVCAKKYCVDYILIYSLLLFLNTI